MTIISPSKKFSHYKFLLIIFGVLILSGVFYIYQYNQMVNLRHAITSLESAIARAEVANTDLKNQLYAAIEPAKLREIAAANGFILDNRPEYLSLKNERWLSDSSY